MHREGNAPRFISAREFVEKKRLSEESLKSCHTEEKLDQWISVETRLPEGNPNFDILVSEAGIVRQDVFWRDGKFMREDNWHFEIEVEGITHWMPLPEGPK